MIFILVIALLIVGFCTGLGIWLWKRGRKPQELIPIPQYSSDERATLKKYFSTSPSRSKMLNEEWADALRAVSNANKLKMLEECADNESTSARTKVIVCAFYKTVMEYRTDSAKVPLQKLFSLLTLYLCMVSDGLELDKRTDYFQYNDDNQTIVLKAEKIIKEMMFRIRYVLNQGYGLPGVAPQLEQDGTKEITLSVDAFLFCMLQSFIAFIPVDDAKCSLCERN